MKPALVLPTALAVLAAGVLVVLTDAAAPAGDRLRDRLPGLIAFVEQERGLQLRREVEVRVLADEQFVRAFRGDDVGGPPAYDLGATYGALGLADEEEFDDEVDGALDAGLVGYYDAVTEELVVRERPLDAYLELVLVHELTHAVQDQWFQTDRPSLADPSERLISFESVVEGDARRVERAYYRQLTDEERELVDRVQGEQAYGPVLGVDALASELDFTYVAGLRFVDALLARGGQERLDAAFRSPPTTTEQVLHPEALDDGPPVSPPAPTRDGERVDAGVLGERRLALLLGLDPLEPGGPQVGWEGDSYATYETSDGALCTAAAVEMADAGARDRLLAALRDIGVDARARGLAGVDLTSCA